MSDAGYSMLGAGAWGWPREMLWGGRWEGGSCLGTHVRIKYFKIKKIKKKNLKKKEFFVADLLWNRETEIHTRSWTVSPSKVNCFLWDNWRVTLPLGETRQKNAHCPSPLSRLWTWIQSRANQLSHHPGPLDNFRCYTSLSRGQSREVRDGLPFCTLAPP